MNAFEAWLDAQGVRRHAGIELKRALDESGWGVHATQDIPKGAIICAVPRNAIFSCRTASLNLSNAPSPESYAEHVLLLTTCLLYELRLGAQSKFFGWLCLLPRETVMIPSLWGNRELAGEDGRKGIEWLKGSAVGSELANKAQEGLGMSDLKAFHADILPHLLPANLDMPPLITFLYVYSLVSSRGFVLDAYHTVGLVPFCDMFNHSSTEPHTSLSNDAGVCETCGSLVPCAHDQVANGELPERIAHLSQAYLNTLQAEGVADKVDMRAHRDIRAGEQIMSCYEEGKSKAAMLVDYGFVEDGVANAHVPWRFKTEDGYPSRTEWPGVTYRRLLHYLYTNNISFPETECFIGSFASTPPLEPPQIRSDSRISFSLFLALWLEHYPDRNVEDMDRLVQDIKWILNDILHPVSSAMDELSPMTQAVVAHITRALEIKLKNPPYLNLRAIEVKYRTSVTRVLDVLPPDAHLERLAIRAVNPEYDILRKCFQFWLIIANQ